MSAEPAICAAPDSSPTSAWFTMPPGAVDSHAHVFGPQGRYGYAPDRQYTPPPVFLDDYLHMLAAVGFSRGVLVQSGVHGVRNDVVVDAMARCAGRFKAVALIAPDVSDAELERLDRAGVRGFRANLVAKIGVQFEAAQALAQRVRHFGWHVQFLLDIEDFPDFDRIAAGFPTQIVVDHMGRPDPRQGVDAPGFQALIRALQAGRTWSKLSAPYRTSREPFPYPDLVPFAHALVRAAPERLVFGTDWPHVMLDSPMPNDGALTDLLAHWVPDEETRRRILVANPEHLYRFE